MKSIVRMMSLCALAVGLAAPADAAPIISAVPNSLSVTTGSSVSVDVIVSGLNDEYVGDYDLTLGWDASLLSLSAVTLDNFLDGPADSLSGLTAGTGWLNVWEVSLSTLASQTGLSSFRLFSIDFATLGSGLASLSFAPGGILGDGLGQSYEFGLNGSQISITAPPQTQVPEPFGFALMGAGLAGLLFARRRAV